MSAYQHFTLPPLKTAPVSVVLSLGKAVGTIRTGQVGELEGKTPINPLHSVQYSLIDTLIRFLMKQGSSLDHSFTFLSRVLTMELDFLWYKTKVNCGNPFFAGKVQCSK